MKDFQRVYYFVALFCKAYVILLYLHIVRTNGISTFLIDISRVESIRMLVKACLAYTR